MRVVATQERRERGLRYRVEVLNTLPSMHADLGPTWMPLGTYPTDRKAVKAMKSHQDNRSYRVVEVEA